MTILSRSDQACSEKRRRRSSCMREVVDLHDQQRCLALVPSRCRCRPRHAWLAALLAPALLGGCVSPPPRVNQAAETRAANDPAAMLRIMPIAAGLAFVILFTVWLMAMLKAHPKNSGANAN